MAGSQPVPSYSSQPPDPDLPCTNASRGAIGIGQPTRSAFVLRHGSRGVGPRESDVVGTFRGVPASPRFPTDHEPTIDVRPASGRFEDFTVVVGVQRPSARGCWCMGYRDSRVPAIERPGYMRVECAHSYLSNMDAPIKLCRSRQVGRCSTRPHSRSSGPSTTGTTGWTPTRKPERTVPNSSCTRRRPTEGSANETRAACGGRRQAHWLANVVLWPTRHGCSVHRLVVAASAQQVDDRHDPAGVHQRQRGRPCCLRAPNVVSRSLSEIDQGSDLQSCLEGATEQNCLSKSRIKVAPARGGHNATLRRVRTEGKDQPQRCCDGWHARVDAATHRCRRGSFSRKCGGGALRRLVRSGFLPRARRRALRQAPTGPGCRPGRPTGGSRRRRRAAAPLFGLGS